MEKNKTKERQEHLEAPLAHTIDLTGTVTSSEEEEPDLPPPSTTPDNPKPPAVQSESPDNNKDVDNEPPAAESGPSNKELAKRFQARMKQKRDERTKQKKRPSTKDKDKTITTPKPKRRRSLRRTGKTKTAPDEDESTPPQMNFVVGSKINGKWKGPSCKGDWYSGTIKSINIKKKTVHVVYDDNDYDKNLSWDDLRVVKK